MAVPVKFNDLFRVYEIKNNSIKSFAETLYDYGLNLSESSAAALTNGFDDHTLRRQLSYVGQAIALAEVMASSPQSDMPQTHPIFFEANLSTPFETFVATDTAGTTRAINEDVANLARQWMLVAVELCMSNSAALPAGTLEHDGRRLIDNLLAIEKYLEDTAPAGRIDVPESAAPAASIQAHGVSTGNPLR